MAPTPIPTPTVKEIMLALSEYAVVDRNATVLEALEALEEAQNKLPQGRQPHRAVLVRNSQNEIIGKLGHLGFLRALLPARKAFLDEEALKRAGVSDDMRSLSLDTFGFVGEELFDVREQASNALVAHACLPTTVTTDENASLFEAIKIFLMHQTLSILVQRDGVTVGVLRLSDLVDELARQARSNQPESAQE